MNKKIHSNEHGDPVSGDHYTGYIRIPSGKQFIESGQFSKYTLCMLTS